MKKISAFSLVELIVLLITISIVLAAFAPMVTKRIVADSLEVSRGKISTRCPMDGCLACTLTECISCSKSCTKNQVLDVPTCSCLNCTIFGANCITCNRNACTACTSGYGLKDGACTSQCPAGKYSDGKTDCLLAPPGHKVGSAGSSTYTVCPAGTYQNVAGSSTCTACPSGTYQNMTGQTGCKPCPEDHSCTASAATACGAHKGSKEGEKNCSNCTDSNCDSCSIPGVCIKCYSGYYLNGTGCSSCPSGYSCDGTTIRKS